MKIILSGGGTMGPVSPLIAVYERVKKQKSETEFLFIGTKTGPEKAVVESYKIPFKAIWSGKWRRYFSGHNLIDPFKIIIGFFQSLLLVIKFKPQVVMVAGGFVGVPVAWAAWLWRVPILIHQQDIVAGLANKLMANIAKKITVSFDVSVKDFFPQKTVLTGNPVREEFFTCAASRGYDIFDLKESLPVLLVLGGGTGAQKVNELVEKSLADLLQFCQIIHVTGRGKKVKARAENYHQFEFLANEIPSALCAADLVISRAGLSTLSELVILRKLTVLIPLSATHQEINANYFKKNNAVVVLQEKVLTKESFVNTVKELLFDPAKRENLSRNLAKTMPADGAERVAELLLSIAKKF